MPYMQRITWSGVALHEGAGVGRPASHGCIRMPREFAAKLLSVDQWVCALSSPAANCGRSRSPMRICSCTRTCRRAARGARPPRKRRQATRTAQAARRQSRDRCRSPLPKPETPAAAAPAAPEPAKTGAGQRRSPKRRTVTASAAQARSCESHRPHLPRRSTAAPAGDAQPNPTVSDCRSHSRQPRRRSRWACQARRSADRPPAPPSPPAATDKCAAPAATPAPRSIAPIGCNAGSADQAATLVETGHAATQGPIAIFVSRKERQDLRAAEFRPLFDAPVTIDHPEQALGTHVFTAMDYLADHSTFRWTVMTLPGEPSRQASSG